MMRYRLSRTGDRDRPRSVRGRRVRVRSAVLAVSVVSVLTACGSSTGTGSSGQSGPTPGTPLSMTVGGFDIPATAALWFAQEKGYFTNAKLDVTIKLLTPPQFVPAVTSNQVNVSFGSLSAVVLASGQGLPVRMLFQNVATTPDNCPLVLQVLPNSPIRTLSDLKGKTIAIDSQNSAEELMLNPILNANGVKVTDVKYLPVGAVGMPGVAAVQKGTADAMVQTEPFSTSLVASGQARLVTNLCVPPAPNPLSNGGYFTSASYASGHTAELTALEQGYLDATRYINAHPDEYNAWLAARYKLPVAQVAAQHLGRPEMTQDDNSYRYLRDAMSQVGLPVANVDIETLRVKLLVAG